MMKEMKIQLMKKFEGSNGYEKRNRKYDNFDKKEVICYRCKEKGHYASKYGNRRDIKCNICGKMGHYTRMCREKNQSGYTLAYHKLPDFFTTYRIYMKNSKFNTHVK